MEKSVYQHKDILKVFPDLSARSLVSWTEKGLLVPFHGDAKGRGTVRKYSFNNIVEAGIIRELMALGLIFRDIKEYFTDVWKEKMRKLNYDCVFIWQRATYKVDQNGVAPMMLRSFHVRVFSMDEFKEYRVQALLQSSTMVRGTDKLIPIGTLPNLTSVLIINVAQIYKNVVGELKQQ